MVEDGRPTRFLRQPKVTETDDPDRVVLAEPPCVRAPFRASAGPRTRDATPAKPLPHDAIGVQSGPVALEKANDEAEERERRGWIPRSLDPDERNG